MADLEWSWRGKRYMARWFKRGGCPYLLGKAAGIVIVRQQGNTASVARVLKVA